MPKAFGARESHTHQAIPNVIQNLAFPAARKSPRIKDRKRPNIIVNMGSLTIFDPRSFGALEMPNFELRSVQLDAYAILATYQKKC